MATKKQETPKQETPAPSQSSLTNVREETRARLAGETKKKIFLALENGEAKGTPMVVRINGYPFTIQKGVEVEVPKSVALILEQKRTIESDLAAAAKVSEYK